MTEEDKPRAFSGDHHHPPPPQPQPFPAAQYGTFQGVSNYPPPRPGPYPAIGFPQPVPPPGVGDPSAAPSPYYPHGYQAVPGISLPFSLFFILMELILFIIFRVSFGFGN